MTEATQRLTAALADRYKIERKLGEGGMASVYLAEDVKHERKVALKILRPELAAVIGGERFLSEIKTTANLQHPHILALFDSGEVDGFLYYVMPYIDGETLREKLEREQQLSVDEAVRIARDVADALDYAHRHDVIHRDIKPANILLHDGRPVVADFGIALAISAAGGGRMTETGLSLGTPHYMSPEQASADRDLSARSDVYSLGCVLYEMLAGQPPHTGPSAQSILVRILTESPRPVTEYRHTVPPHIAAVVTKAIEKLPADRFESAREFLDALGDEGFEYAARPATNVAAAAAAPAAEPAKASRGLVAATAVLAATSLLFGWMALGSGGPATATSGAVTAFVLQDDYLSSWPPVVGPDGSVVLSLDDALHLRAPGSLALTPLVGAERSRYGAFSPDGEWLAFAQSDNNVSALKRMPAHGGPVTTLWTPDIAGDEGAFWGLDWGDDGWIYLDVGGAVARVPQEGGPAERLLETAGTRVTQLEALPGGKGLLFTIAQAAGAVMNRVILMNLETRDTTTFIADGFDARYVSSGHLLYAHQGGALYAMPFDAERLQATGPPVPVVDDLATTSRLWGRYDVSPGGTLVYAQGEPTGATGGGGLKFGFVDSGGGLVELPLEQTDHPDADLSADGRMLAYIRSDQVWIYDIELGTNRQFSSDGTGHHNPIWSPDASEIAFRSTRGDETSAIYIRRADGSEPARRVGSSGAVGDNPAQWLDDGTILFDTEGASRDIYSVDAAGGADPEPVLQADWIEAGPSVSPDGRWLAFVSFETGSPQLYLRRWPELTGKVQVTSDQGFVSPVQNLIWSREGTRLFFVVQGSIWEAAIGGGETPDFALRNLGVTATGVWGVHPDGRLLVTLRAGTAAQPNAEPAESPRLVVVSNWLTALRARLGDGN